MKNKYTIQDIFRKYDPEYIKHHKLSEEQRKVYNAITSCKTKELGIHNITCKEYGETITGFNSCRNRHCPMCQSYARECWIENQSYFFGLISLSSNSSKNTFKGTKHFGNVIQSV